MVAMILLAGIVFVGTTRLRASGALTEVSFRTDVQALDVARAGLVDAFAWFRRRPTQPVDTFAPERDMSQVPAIDETEDPAIGIVRQYEIGDGLWGRYEVRLPDDRDGDGTIGLGEGVVDVTQRRSRAVAGTVWHLECVGSVFKRIDPAVALGVSPNERVATATASTEIRRLAIVPPAEAALIADRGLNVTVGVRGRVDGGKRTAIVYPLLTGVPTVLGELRGLDTLVSLVSMDTSWEAVFGASREELIEVASIHVTDPAEMPAPVPDFALVFVEGDVTFGPTKPLSGTGLLIVDGNVTIEHGSNSYFAGMIYVTGNYTQRAPSLVRGTVIVQGVATVEGLGDYSEVVFDQAIIDALNLNVGPYRMMRALRRLDRAPRGGR